MNYEIVTKEGFRVCGLNTELTTSQNENYKIIRGHWQKFNNELKVRKVKSEKDWVKYGITKKIEGKYLYITAIPFDIGIKDFEVEEINGGKFICFRHTGRMELIKSTIHRIYRQIIPASDFNVDGKRTMVHYEQYDYRFSWNKSESIIDIYVPIESNT
jgi:predicted transcriptional regulator YdeE